MAIKKKELTDKQERFIEEYLKDFNATQAAIRAGYSEANADKIGSELLGKTRVKEALEKKRAKITKKAETSVEWVLEKLKTVAERCLQEEAVNDKDGNFTGVFKFEAAGVNRALELIGKYHGMFRDKIEHTGKDGEAIKHEVDAKVTLDVIDTRITEMLGANGYSYITPVDDE
jgi:phage terminase small subunit